MVTTLTTCGVNESGALLKESMSIRPEAIGKIIMFAGSTAPEGTLHCNGAAISRTTYSELFAAIGTTYGAGDGSTTFNLPDLRGKWMVGADAERAAGEEVAEGLPNVKGQTGLKGGDISIGDVKLVQNQDINPNNEGALYNLLHQQGFYTAGQGVQRNDYHIDGIILDLSRGDPIYGASQHVTPASVALLPCIIYE